MSTYAMLCNNAMLDPILTKTDAKDSNRSRATDQLFRTTLDGLCAQHAYHVELSSGIVLRCIVGLALALGCLLIPPLLIGLLLMRRMISLLVVIALPALPSVHLCCWLPWSQWLQVLFWDLVGYNVGGPVLGGLSFLTKGRSKGRLCSWRRGGWCLLDASLTALLCPCMGVHRQVTHHIWASELFRAASRL